ncbi:MAG: hypothetical protein KatS3mg010_1898 [Acidimicrobiia bacterium]|nr:MAG: hypothetical protein KatS3mg010_1898 [Acidimicrobiia bacterium]
MAKPSKQAWACGIVRAASPNCEKVSRHCPIWRPA